MIICRKGAENAKIIAVDYPMLFFAPFAPLRQIIILKSTSLTQIFENGLFHRRQFRLDLEQRAGALLDGDIGILEAVAGEGANDAAAVRDPALADVVQGAGESGRRGRFAEDTLLPGEQLLGGENLLVALPVEPAARFFLHLPGLVPGLRGI